MRTYTLTRAPWRRVVSATAALALPLGLMALSMSPAEAAKAPGSPIEAFTDTVGNSDVADAIENGFWGYEGGANNGTGPDSTFFDLDASDLAALQATFPNFGDVRVAFVSSSANGSAEHPVASAGQTVDQVFGASSWIMDAGFGTSLAGVGTPNDGVAFVSTPAEYDAWYAAGQQVQGFNNNLQVLDVNAPGAPVSSTPKGKSILNRWAAGQNISMVFYQSTGAAIGGKPVVQVGADGHAMTAYMAFKTVAKPGDASRSSAGYKNLNFGVPAVGTTTTLTASPSGTAQVGTAVNLDAHVTATTGTATGSVEFFDGTTSLGTSALNGSGHATKSVSSLAIGNHQLSAKFIPSGSFAVSETATPVAYSITAVPAVPTHTAVAAVPGADNSVAVPLTATVTADDSSCPAGTVEFKEGPNVLATVTTPDANCVYEADYTFALPGGHTVTAVFTPAGNYGPSQGSVTFNLAAGDGTPDPDEQPIKVNVPVGALSITTPYTQANPLDLGDMALTTDLMQYQATASFNGIHLLDTRAGSKPWTVSALSSQLSSGSNAINAQNVGLTALGLDSSNGFVQHPGAGTITTTDNPAASPAVAAGAAGSAGLGGATPHTVLHDTAGPADVQYKGTLTVNAPTTTQPGLYQGVITFTAA
jgi:hypothetical protein